MAMKATKVSKRGAGKSVSAKQSGRMTKTKTNKVKPSKKPSPERPASKAVAKRVMDAIWARWSSKERKVLSALDSPMRIQQFLDKCGYDPEYGCKSVRMTLERRVAHCLGGSLFACYCLRRLGYASWIVGLSAVNDDSHAICVYSQKRQGRTYYGAISKSNFTVLRGRDCVHESVKQVVMTYWDFYFNTAGEKSLVSYMTPYDPFTWPQLLEDDAWLFAGKHCDAFEDWMDDEANLPAYPLLGGGAKFDVRREGKKVPAKSDFARAVFHAPKYIVKAGTIDSNPAGLYKP
jgi:hypothetical protein